MEGKGRVSWQFKGLRSTSKVRKRKYYTEDKMMPDLYYLKSHKPLKAYSVMFTLKKTPKTPRQLSDFMFP